MRCPTTNAICELAEQLVSQRVERVVVESTSDYWQPLFYLVEAAGLTVWLVNARDVKPVSGRPETDKLGCGVVGEAPRTWHAARLVCARRRWAPAAR